MLIYPGAFRDLKPANVLISDRNDVNICDFGLSRLIDPEMTSMTAEVMSMSILNQTIVLNHSTWYSGWNTKLYGT